MKYTHRMHNAHEYFNLLLWQHVKDFSKLKLIVCPMLCYVINKYIVEVLNTWLQDHIIPIGTYKRLFSSKFGYKIIVRNAHIWHQLKNYHTYKTNL